MKIKTPRSSVMAISVYKCTRCENARDLNPSSHRSENVKTYRNRLSSTASRRIAIGHMRVELLTAVTIKTIISNGWPCCQKITDISEELPASIFWI
jgi:hypothetical protein